ncbi:MAG: PTS glucose transporter subunit IIA [Clostridia bacterium]|nr:PTS glucose transporter subunit IIA [Clostridia bacterium]
MLFSKFNARLLAVTDGNLLPLSQVPDQAFSSGILGQGYAIDPTAGTVYSPVSGTVDSIAETRHAYTILSEDGLDVLIHVGIDTVELKGEGFLPMVKIGDKVKAGDVLARADLDLIRSRGYATVIPVLITNPEALQGFRAAPAKTVTGGKSEALEYRIKS